MYNGVIFGGSGGLGQQVTPLLRSSMNLVSLGSADVDVTRESEIEGFFAAHKVDVVIHLAVLNIDALVHKTVHAEVERQLAVNVLGTTSILRHALPYMRQQRYGRIIFVSSVLADRPTPGTGIYASCKSFNETLIRVAARENKAYGITCNVLRLGYFDAGLIARVPVETKETIRKEAGRFGSIEELSSCIHLLLQNAYINGAIIKIDGGL